MLPYFEVSHLPSSSSFFSSITHPLGIRYLSTSTSSSGVPSIVFGTTAPLFEIHQAGDRGLKLSRIVISARSPEEVEDFHSAALRAYPRCSAVIGVGVGLDADGPQFSSRRSGSDVASLVQCGETRAKVTDLDGNIMEVVYVPPSNYPSRYGGSTVRRTQSTESEANRILDWNYDVATSETASNARHAGRYADIIDDAPYPSPLRPSPRENSKGITAAGVAGIIGAAAVGAAAGAAITYTMMGKDRRAAPREEFEAAPPPFQRRSTFPEQYPAAPAPAPDRRGRYVEVERSVEKVRYPEDYREHRQSAPGPPPAYLARYSQVGSERPPPRTRSREVDDMYDDSRSRHSSRYTRPSTVRTRSEAPVSRAPLLISDAESRGGSYVGSRQASAAPPPAPSRVSMRRSATFDAGGDRDRDSYVSARSQRTTSTLRGPPPPAPAPAPSAAVARSRAASRVSVSTIKAGGDHSPPSRSPRDLGRAASYISARHVPLPQSEVSARSARHIPLPPSEVSARHVPLPASRVGSNWEVDDDADSIAPSDSISCVGSRRSGRSYH